MGNEEMRPPGGGARNVGAIGRDRDVQRWGRGQGFVEYALIILFVVLIVFGGLFLLGPVLTSIFNLVPPAL